MTDTLTITGFVATPPRQLTTADGYALTSFRLASNLRRFDRTTKSWVDAGTNWYTVSTYRQMATNVAASVHKGDRVLVTGRLRIRDWQDGEKKGMNIDLDADALGHDLGWGTASFTRTIHSSEVEAVGSGAQADDAPEEQENGDQTSADASAEARELEQVAPF
ncbi:single-strand DNA-binding protein [Cryobacterium mesophilum]|uniref:Single-stranded DNA-binding protein n=1 Tax=Terrimesophilobacter mesophilus TaxID=433647 RepID=A0A4R8VAU8_9MICO|nr:single-stranded DNA-binding protein [Terrimesophilobacter mesophilus]MBB5632382.1 single-strand DNA-binding protein [Terrimesophilobacter mesophilus]TFB79220.1 single-stranded DNA-binding protein [Terrimesophilobacter mesophilus]